jgi:hypothetical protein
MVDGRRHRDCASTGAEALRVLLKALWAVDSRLMGCTRRVLLSRGSDVRQKLGPSPNGAAAAAICELRLELHRRAILANPRGRLSQPRLTSVSVAYTLGCRSSR